MGASWSPDMPPSQDTLFGQAAGEQRVADGSFGVGLATAGFTTQDDYGRDVVVDAAGRILVSGQLSNLSNPDFAVARFTPAGLLDASFDDDGKFTVDFFNSFDSAENVAVHRRRQGLARRLRGQWNGGAVRVGADHPLKGHCAGSQIVISSL